MYRFVILLTILEQTSWDLEPAAYVSLLHCYNRSQNNILQGFTEDKTILSGEEPYRDTMQ